MEAKVSTSLENYLETILFLADKNGKVRITDIAGSMNISKPSVHKAVNVLTREGYIFHEKYKPIELTEKGLKAARNIAARHNAITRFLTEILEIAPEEAEREACLLEHAMSVKTVEKLLTFLNKYKKGKTSV